jgi:hypothetical protein
MSLSEMQDPLYRLNEPAVIADVIDGEAVIMNLERGSYYGLDQIGADIWQMILTGRTFDEIATTIAQHFGVERERVASDVNALAAQMIEEKLIVPDPAGEERVREPHQITVTVYATPVLTVYSDMKDLLALDPPMPGLEPASNA